MPLTFAETPLYYRDSQGQYHRVLSGADMTGYRTAAAQDAIDAAQDAEIDARAKANEVGIVITGKRPSMAVTAGQYVIVRNSTISGISDGLYTANTTLSPSTDVTAANLSAVSKGGLNAESVKISANTTNISALQDRFPTASYNDFNAFENVYQPMIFKLATGSQNAPDAGAYVCFQQASSSKYAVQLAFKTGATTIYMRAKKAGTWGNWVNMALS